ncbi:hypothetical protein [Roseococcus sp.]|uniref:hypothetical protein n=1 Tax=Roseococcus sp. TaxID=2109646 RepID=UPI003BAA5E38
MNTNDTKSDVCANGAQARNTPAPVPGALEFNPDNYRAELSEFDMDDAQKDELLRVIFEIMRSFVEMGIDVDNIAPLLPSPDGESRSE